MVVSPSRSRNMAAIRSKNTKPEVVVRKYLWNHGLRYRLNYSSLPGKPDIVLKKYKTCIFVNGCFWHGHSDCRYHVIPKTRTSFWLDKINRNRERDREVLYKLIKMGWHCVTIWECELKPKCRQDTLERLLVTLDKAFKAERKAVRYNIEESESGMVAEDSETYFKS